MWFKQLTVFLLPEPPDADVVRLSLGELTFVPCTGMDWFSDGFAAPQPFAPDLAYIADKTVGVALKREEKVLPAGVIQNALAERVQKIEVEEGRAVGRREKQEMKEQITDELLPRALTRSSHTRAVFVGGKLLVDTTGAAKAEYLLFRLREALGGLAARLPKTRLSPIALMTEWLLRGEAAGNFELDSDALLRGVGDAAPEVKVRRQDLTAEEVVQHVKSGKSVVELGLVWNEKVAFVLTANFTLKRIQYLDILHQEAGEQGDAAASLAFAAQILMSAALTDLIDELAGHLDGWAG